MPHALPVFALSIRQPFAWLIANGHKAVENRTWRTNYRGPIAIHASAKPCPDLGYVCEEIAREFGITFPPEVELGGIVGVATLADCVTDSRSPWFSGPFGFVLTDARPVPFVEMPGALGIWRIPTR